MKATDSVVISNVSHPSTTISVVQRYIYKSLMTREEYLSSLLIGLKSTTYIREITIGKLGKNDADYNYNKIKSIRKNHIQSGLQ